MMKHTLTPVARSRVNITLDVPTQNGVKKTELPFKLLALGDFSRRSDKVPLSQRKRIPITKQTFEQVLAEIAPQLNLIVPDLVQKNDSMKVKLDFKCLADFSPEQIAARVPELARLIAMRNILKELKSWLIDDKALRQALSDIAKDPDKFDQLKQAVSSRLTIEN